MSKLEWIKSINKNQEISSYFLLKTLFLSYYLTKTNDQVLTFL